MRGLIHAILGSLNSVQDSFTLVRTGNGLLTGKFDNNSGFICRAVVYHDRSDKTIEGKEVSFTVLDGKMDFGSGKKEVKVKSEIDGVATATIFFSELGAGRVVASLTDNPDIYVIYDLRTNGITHEIKLYTEPCHSVGTGEVNVNIVVLDCMSEPVNGAKILFDAVRDPNLTVGVDVQELGNGQYKGVFKSKIAGRWDIFVEDPDSKVVGHTPVHLLPGPAKTIAILNNTDPRYKSPRNSLSLHAVLLDEHGNSIDPHRLLAQTANGEKLSRNILSDEAVFEVSRMGPGKSTIKLYDDKSEVILETIINFAAANLSMPEYVEAKHSFKMPVYLFPPLDSPITKANVKIVFDPEMSSFVGFEPEQHDMILISVGDEEEKLVSLNVNSEVELSSKEFPEGVFLGITEWECLGEGNTCFSVTAVMSPESEPWDRCLPQKIFSDEKIPLCINIMFNAQDPIARQAGIEGAETVESVISAIENLGSCCPKIEVSVHTCSIQTPAWRRITRNIDRDGTISSPQQFNWVMQNISTNQPGFYCRRNKCLNIIMISFSDTFAVRGMARYGIGAAVDPNKAGNYTMAHEVAHLLGIPDRYIRNPITDEVIDRGSRKDLMGAWGSGYLLTTEDCKKIHEEIEKFSG